MPAILVIDQGTTAPRAIVLAVMQGGRFAAVASARQEFTPHCPAPGRVEQDPPNRIPGAPDGASRGECAFGRLDRWLIWPLTGGRVQATDASNATRSLLVDRPRQEPNTEIRALLDRSIRLLPPMHDCAAAFATMAPGRLVRDRPSFGGAGDQQATSLGPACFAPGRFRTSLPRPARRTSERSRFAPWRRRRP